MDNVLDIQKHLAGGRVHEIVRAKLSTWAQGLLYHRRQPLTLERHQFMLPVYDTSRKRILLKTARQVSKSTSLCNILLTQCFLNTAMRVLYVSPSALQTRQFSNEKLRPAIYDSPLVMKYFFNRSSCIDQTFEKSFTNGSHMFLRYAFLTADRARGIPCELLCLDEIQDILRDNVRIIAESLSAAGIMDDSGKDLGVEIQAGTPKTFENTIEESWGLSSQNEWMVPCDRHTPKQWVFMDASAIGKKGPVCSKCKEPIDVAAGRWVSFNPEGEYYGFRVSQLMVPWKLREERWQSEIVWKYENSNEGVFNNEVLGLSYDNSQKPINIGDIQKCCYPVNQVDTVDSATFHHVPVQKCQQYPMFMGVDYGEGREEGKVEGGKKKHASFTVVSIGTYVTPDRWWWVSIRRYRGKEADPEFIKEDLVRLFHQFDIQVLGADWGHGWGMNSYLFKKLGQSRVMQFYHSDSLAERKKWDPGGWKFIVNRNAVISDFLTDVKSQKFLYPTWAETKTFGEDILGVYADYNSRTRRMYYDHPLDQPDDAMHSQIYAKLAADIHLGKF